MQYDALLASVTRTAIDLHVTGDSSVVANVEGAGVPDL